MRRTALIAAVVGGTLASTTFGAFVVTASTNQGTAPIGLPAGRSWIDLTVLNNGTGGTGTQLKGVDFTSVTATGGKIYFKVDDLGDTVTQLPDGTFEVSGDPDGIPETADPFNGGAGANGNSSLRVNTGGANNAFVGFNPVISSQPNAYTAGVTSFSGSIANLASTSANTTAFRFARFIVDTGTTLTINGLIGGDTGDAQQFVIGDDPVNVLPTVTVTPSTLTIDVSPAGLESGAATVVAVDSDGTVVSLVVNPASLGVLADNFSVTGDAASGLSVSLSNLTYEDFGSHAISFTATDNEGGIGQGILTVNIVPEPASLGLIGLAGLGLVRRRK